MLQRIAPRRARSLPVLGGAAWIALALVSPARAIETVRPDLWVANGSVLAMARSGNTLFLGGSFDHVGPATGCFAWVDTSSGAPTTPTDRVLANLGADYGVLAMTDDGAGGWYLGGRFSHAGGVAQTNLTHLLAGGARDASFNVAANGIVRAVRRVGTTLYVGGEFTTLGGLARNRLGAIDLTTGAVTSWNPAPNAVVRALEAGPEYLYVGGDFTSIAGQTRRALVAFSLASGALAAWNPGSDGRVWALHLAGPTLYAGGGFGSLSAITRPVSSSRAR